MSANDHTTAHEEAHTGPIKTPKQLLAAVFFSFVIPIFGIIGLVYYVSSANAPGAGADDSPKAVSQRIQKIGSVEIRDANRPLKSGEEVYKAQCVACHAAGAGEALYKQACVACHAAGVAGSPKFGDKEAWAPRIKTGLDMLTASVVKGKGAMPPKGGSAASDTDIRAAVEYMVAAAK
jgi:cytochrome c5